MGMTLDEAIERYTRNAECERTHGDLQGCLEFRRLVEWLKDYKRLKEQEPKPGHWIAKAPQYDMLNPQYICSECGNAHTRTTSYCEMCGAKMIEPQESEE